MRTLAVSVFLVLLLASGAEEADAGLRASQLRAVMADAEKPDVEKIASISNHYRYLITAAKAALDGEDKTGRTYFAYYDLARMDFFHLRDSVVTLFNNMCNGRIAPLNLEKSEYLPELMLNEIQMVDAMSRGMSNYYELLVRKGNNPGFVVEDVAHLPKIHPELVRDPGWLRSNIRAAAPPKPTGPTDAEIAKELGIEMGIEELKFMAEETPDISERLTFYRIPAVSYLTARDRVKRSANTLSADERQLWEKRLAYWSDLHNTSWFMGEVEGDLQAYRQDPLLNPDKREGEIKAYAELLDIYRALYRDFSAREDLKRRKLQNPMYIEKPRPWEEELAETRIRILSRVQDIIDNRPNLGLEEGFPRSLTEEENQELIAAMNSFIGLLEAGKARQALSTYTDMIPTARNISSFSNPNLISGFKRYFESIMKYQRDWVALSGDNFVALSLDPDKKSRMESFTFTPAKRRNGTFQLQFWQIPMDWALMAWLLRDKLSRDQFWNLCFDDYYTCKYKASFDIRMRHWKKQEGITDEPEEER